MRALSMLFALSLAASAPTAADQRDAIGKRAAVRTEPCATVRRIDVTGVKGPVRTWHGYGHEFTVEIELAGSKEAIGRAKLEWWEYVSYRGSSWFSDRVHPVEAVRPHVWQDHVRINPKSRMWGAWRRSRETGQRVIRLVDKPSIPLGNVRLGDAGREYSNIARQLWIEARARSGGGRTGHAGRSVWIYQSLSEKEGKPAGAVLSYGPSRIRSAELLSVR